MNRPVSCVMQRRVCTVGMECSLAELENLFAREGLSWAPVLDESHAPVGVVSASDVLRARSSGRNGAAPAWQLCSYKPVTVTPNASAGEVARLMLEQGIHHVLVMEDGRIRGVVSALDLLRWVVPHRSAAGAEVA